MTFRDELAGGVGRCLYCESPLRIDAREPIAVEAPSPAPKGEGSALSPLVERLQRTPEIPPEPQAPALKPPLPSGAPAAPWEGTGRSVLGAWWLTWFESLFHPARLADRLEFPGSAGKAATYVMAGMGQLLGIPLGLLALTATMMVLNPAITGRAYVFPTLAAGIGWGAVAVAGSVGVIAAWAAVLHGCVRAVGGTGPYVATFRCAAYASGSAIALVLALFFVPTFQRDQLWFWFGMTVLVAGLVPLHQVLALPVLLSKGHGLSHGRALAAVLAPVLWIGLAALIAGIFFIATEWLPFWRRWRYGWE